MITTPEQYAMLRGRTALLFEYHKWMNAQITREMGMHVLVDNYPGHLTHAEIVQQTMADVVPLHIDEYVDVESIVGLEESKRKKVISVLRHSGGASRNLRGEYRRLIDAGVLYVYLGDQDFFDKLAFAFYTSIFEL